MTLRFCSAVILALAAATACAQWHDVGNVTEVVPQARGVLLRSEGGTVAISAVSAEILRVHFTPRQQFGREHSWAIVQRDFGAFAAKVSSDAE
jgi:hypothetical protein